MDRVVEVKRRLDGTEARFECDRVLVEPGRRAVIRYVLDRAWSVPGISLRAGMETYAHFWTDRPYNAYHWVDGGQTVGVYFNVGPCEAIAVDRVVWTDYIVDVLVTPDGDARVLDEDEIDDGTPAPVREVIATMRAYLVAERSRLVHEIAAETDRLRR